MEEFTKVLGTRRQLLTAYHPQTDGQMERINQEIEIFLWHYVNYQQDNWIDWLAAAEFQYNDKKTYSSQKDTIWVKLWKVPIERWPCGSNVNSTSRKFPYQNTEELGTGNKGDRRSAEKDKEAI